jgi:uncharacterized protein (DUF1501 family)
MSQTCGCSEAQGLSRRSFLKRSAAVGAATGLAAGGLGTRLAFASGPYTGDVVVVVSLRGGFDGLNAVVPAGDADYSRWRPSIGIPQGALLPLGGIFGMHPAMAALQPFWDSGSLGFVHAVGQVNPTRSHFEAMEEMERAAPGTSTRTGWLDRTLGLRDLGSAFQGVSLGGGLAPSSFAGPHPELAMWSVDSFELDGAWDTTERQRWSTALRALHSGAPAAIGGPAETTLGALATTGQLKDAGYVPANGAVYPDGDLGGALRDVARLVKADVGLQVACVDYGDWDMHADMGTPDTGWMHDHLAELAGALAAFGTDLGAKLSDVTLVTLTEFGRRVEENGSGGAEHGHGQAVFMLGGGVVGGQVHGRWPGLRDADLVDGDLAGTTDYRQILAEVLEKRCGASGLSTVFPGVASERLGVVRARV